MRPGLGQISMSEETAYNLVRQLPGMTKRPDHGLQDYFYGAQNQKIEAKYSNPRQIRYSVGYAHQYSWGDIAARDFNWLLLIGEDESKGKLDFWLLAALTARNRLMTRSCTITFTLYALARRPKGQFMERCRMDYKTLYARCESGEL